MPSSTSIEDQNRKREELQANWKVPSIAQFISLFRVAFKLPEIEIEDLEEGLIDEKSVERRILTELLVALIRGINYKANSYTWEFFLRRLVKHKFIAEGGACDPYLSSEEENKNKDLHSETTQDISEEFDLEKVGLNLVDLSFPDKEFDNGEPTFWKFDTSVQVDILLFLCYKRLDRSDAIEATKTMDAEALRAQPLGCDDVGNEYWYFFGTRLYKQEPAPQKQSKSWEEEWNEQKEKAFKKRGRGRPPKKLPCKPRKSDGESDELEDRDASNNRRFMNIDEKSRWSVVCNTIEDWVEFAEKFKDSKSKCERSLFVVVQENFLPALSEIYQEKERRLKQKLKDLIPPRSTIITRRETRQQNKTIVHGSPDSNEYGKEQMKRSRADRLEERNRRASGEVNRSRGRARKPSYYNDSNDEEISDETASNASEASNNSRGIGRRPSYYKEDTEEEMSEDICNEPLPSNANKANTNPRRKGKRPRYYKEDTEEEMSEEICNEPLPCATSKEVRQTRKRVIYYNEDDDEEVSEEVCEEQSFNEDKYVRDHYPLLSDDGIDLKNEVLKLIGEVKVHKDAWPFIHPVKKEEAPGYYEIISQPIDLSIITQKLLDGSYCTVRQMESDFHKLVSNCRLYNGENTGPTKMANTVLKVFQCGLVKILEGHRLNKQNAFNAFNSNETSSVTVTAKYSRTQVISKRSTNTYEGRKGKRKVRNMDAIEALSRESEIAVEKSNSEGYLESLQATNEKNNSFSTLRIIPTHSNPVGLFKKFMSDNTIQELDALNNCNDDSSFVDNESSDSIKNYDSNSNNAGSSPSNDENSYLDSSNNDDNSNASVFADKNDSDVENSSQEKQENISTATTTILQTRASDSVSPNSSQQNDRKSSSSSEGLIHGMASILDACTNQNISNLLSGFCREPLYSASEAIVSPRDRVASSPHSRKSDSSSPEQVMQSPQNSSPNLMQSSVVEKDVPFLQDRLSIQTDHVFNNFSSVSDTSTVDASVLGFSSFAKVPEMTSNQLGSKQTTSPPLTQVASAVASITTHMPSSSVPSPFPPVRVSPPMQVNSTYETMFPHHNPVQLFRPEPNKFPTMKVSLPPSTGEILVVPDKTNSNKMTFHLLAQPHSNPSQPIQSCIELRADSSSTSPSNQVHETMEIRTEKENSTYPSFRRTSPTINISQFPSVSNNLSMMPQQVSEKNIPGGCFTSSIRPIVTFPNFTTNSNNPTVASTYANSFMPVNTSVTNPLPLVPKTDNQSIRSSAYTFQSANQSKATRLSTSIGFNPGHSNVVLQAESSSKTLSSTFNVTSSPNYRMATGNKGIKSRSNSTTQREMAVNVPNNSNFFNLNGVQNSNGQYEVVSLPRVDGTQAISRVDGSGRLFTQNAVKPISEGVTATPFYPPSYANPMQSYTFPSNSLNAPLAYAQVNPSQSSHFVNIPSYMIANQNMFQHPLNHVVMNVQPFHVSNRPVLSMDLGSR